MNIYKHCGELINCPHCGAIHEITLSDCCCFEHDSKSTIRCDICGLYYSIVPFQGEKDGVFVFKTIG